jgi:small subunit ribosomal protein S2
MNKLNNKYMEQYIKLCLQQGHVIKKWNPKMAPYILTEKKGSYLFNTEISSKMLESTGNMLKKKAKENGTFLFIGTESITSSTIKSEAILSKSSYVNYRWLGGMLTNWATVQSQLEFLRLLEIQRDENKLKNLTKKEFALREKKIEKLKKLFEGVKNMKNLPDVAIIINQSKDFIALQECIHLGIPTVCIVDTNSNPELVSYPIPANESSIISVKFILQYLSKKIIEGYNEKENL